VPGVPLASTSRRGRIRAAAVLFWKPQFVGVSPGLTPRTGCPSTSWGLLLTARRCPVLDWRSALSPQDRTHRIRPKSARRSRGPRRNLGASTAVDLRVQPTPLRVGDCVAVRAQPSAPSLDAAHGAALASYVHKREPVDTAAPGTASSLSVTQVLLLGYQGRDGGSGPLFSGLSLVRVSLLGLSCAGARSARPDHVLE